MRADSPATRGCSWANPIRTPAPSAGRIVTTESSPKRSPRPTVPRWRKHSSGDLRAFRKGRPSPAATRCSSKRRRRSPRERLVTSAPASSRAPSSRGSAKRLFWVSSVAAPDSPPGSLTLAEAKQAPRTSFEEPLGVGGEVELTGLVSEREGIEVGQRRLVEDHRVVGAEQDLASAVGRAQ
jgi:hypothetical protein